MTALWLQPETIGTLLLNFGSPAKIEAVVIIDSPESSSNLSSFVGGGE